MDTGPAKPVAASRLFSSIVTVLSGSVAAQLIAIAALPILTRIYSAEDFGRYQIYVSALNVLMIFAAFRYEVAILNARPGRVLASLLKLAFWLCVATSFVTLLVAFVAQAFCGHRAEWFNESLFILPGAMFVAGVYQMLAYLPIRHRDYRLSARSKVAQAAGFTIGGIGFAFLPFANVGLLLADILGRAVASALILFNSGTLWRTFLTPVSLFSMRIAALRFRKFGYYTFPGTLLSALVAAMMPFAFLTLFGLQVAGQYALVERFIMMPVAMIATALSQVYTGEFSALFRNGKAGMNQAFRASLLQLLAAGLLPTLLGMAFSPILVPIVFGQDWALAGKLCAIAFPIAYVRFVAASLTMVLITADRQSLQFRWEIGRFVFMLGLFFLLFWLNVRDPVTVMICYGVAIAISYGVQLLLTDHATKLVSSQAVEAG